MSGSHFPTCRRAQWPILEDREQQGSCPPGPSHLAETKRTRLLPRRSRRTHLTTAEPCLRPQRAGPAEPEALPDYEYSHLVPTFLGTLDHRECVQMRSKVLCDAQLISCLQKSPTGIMIPCSTPWTRPGWAHADLLSRIKTRPCGRSTLSKACSVLGLPFYPRLPMHCPVSCRLEEYLENLYPVCPCPLKALHYISQCKID